MVKIIKTNSERTFYYNECTTQQKPMVAVKRNTNSNKYYNFEYDFFDRQFKLKYEVVEELRKEANKFLKEIQINWSLEGYPKKHEIYTAFGEIEGVLSKLTLDDAIEFATRSENILLNKKNWYYPTNDLLINEKKPILKIKKCEFPVTYDVGKHRFDNKKEFYKITYNLFPVQSKLSKETVTKLLETHKKYYYNLKKDYENPNNDVKELLGHFPDHSNSVNCMSGWVGSYWETDAMNLLSEFEEIIMNKNNWESYSELFDKDFFCKDWISSEKETIEKIKKLKEEEGGLSNIISNLTEHQTKENLQKLESIKKEILLLQELLPKNTKLISDYKTINTIIINASKEEGYNISKYLVEKFSQAIIEGTQDFFKDVFKEQQEQSKEMKEWITESLTRSREYQRWSEHEIHSLIYLWKVQCKNPADIGRLMQRSSESIEKMIDFVESDKYLNHENFYKKIKTTEVKE